MVNQKNRQAVLLVNLGSPASPSARDVRRYLREFLMDGYVIDLPYPLRWIVVHLFILPFRPRRSARAYAKIWTAQGSPLLINTRLFADKLQKFTKKKIFWAMRYGQPSIASVLKEMRAENFEKVLVAPLYPHHALSSTVTAFHEATRHATPLGLKLDFLPAFYDLKAHQAGLARQIKKFTKSSDFILFSYHGLPVRHITKADPTGSHCMRVENCCMIDPSTSPGAALAHKTCYRHQVIETTNAAAKILKLKRQNFGFSFQSRLGSAEWLKPMTSEFVADLARKGIRNLAIVAPAFVCDNLETLEEVNMQLRDIFLNAGGTKFTYVPCLNDNTDWARGFATLLTGK